MNNLSIVAKTLFHFLNNRNTFLFTTSEINDFRTNTEITIKLYGKGQIVEFPVTLSNSFIGLLTQSIFSDNKVVIGWNIKKFFSYLRFHLNYKTYCNFIDLKLGESYLGLKKECPTSFDEAIKRASFLISSERYVKINNIVFSKLATEVIPQIETKGILNKEVGQKLYPCYDIEGQVNGRLNTSIPTEGYFNPHSLSLNQRKGFYAGYDRKFLAFDFKHTEASLLAWLSKDELLNGLIDSGEDLYSGIFKVISGSYKCSEKDRQLIKDVFIKIIYGCGVNGLANETGYSANACSHLIKTIHKNFSTAFEWLEEQQNKLKQNRIIEDVFGRVLDFTNREDLGVRNAVIQSPTALICLEKLVELGGEKIVASIHDGYICIVDALSWEATAIRYKEILEKPSQFAPDLKLKVRVSVGEDWGYLKNVQEE